jgi:nucleoid-associated protein YgaU
MKVRYDGKRVYKSIIYPPVSPSISDLQVISNEGDYLDTLAYKYYRDPTLWFVIALANPGIGRGRLSVTPGLTLRIPIDISGYLNEFNRMNS